MHIMTRWWKVICIWLSTHLTLIRLLAEGVPRAVHTDVSGSDGSLLGCSDHRETGTASKYTLAAVFDVSVTVRVLPA